jgi:hypothetical protein
MIGALLIGPLCAHGSAATLATDGQARIGIVRPADATPAEQTAAAELVDYLGKATGGRFTVTEEGGGNGPAVYVGPTRFAVEHGIDAGAFGPEEWIIRTVDDSLVICGGRPRGTLYGVYRFLEDVVGVHWWNAYREAVPNRPTLDVGALDLRGKPVLRYRDIYMLYANDGGRFAARNRLNRQGDAGIEAGYGGDMGYGPPYHVHTFYMYVPPNEYFAPHPEWFSLIDGERKGDGQYQLCLTNQALRDFMVRKLKSYIDTSRAAAEAAGKPPPVVYDISQNDWGGQCQCDACQAIAKAEESEAGPLLGFLNYIAEAIKDEYPDVYIDTLAYTYTQKAPKTIKPRDNLIIRLCDTGSNFTRSITDPENAAFREHLLSWAKIAKNLRIWDYAVSYAQYYGLPLPTVHTYPVDYRFYAEHNVEGVFTEHEYTILADLRDFKIWMMMKLLEDPYQDYDKLVTTFTDGFYGAAGKTIREYLAKLDAASAEKISYLSMGASPPNYRYLDLAFVTETQRLFDRAEAAVQGDAELLQRVRHARLPLDRASVVRYPALMREWLAQGKDPAAMPLDRDAIADRYQQTWYAQIDLRLPANERAAEKERCDAEVAALTSRKAYVPLPERFRNLPPGTVFDFTADATRNWQDIVEVVPADTESGVTNRLQLTDALLQEDGEGRSYALPMPWGLYDQVNKQGAGGAPIKPEDVPGPGYHWYRMGVYKIVPSHYLYFFWSWIIQLDIDSVIDPKDPDAQFEVWANIAFEGPGFPHGKVGEKNAICVERVVLVKATKAGR